MLVVCAPSISKISSGGRQDVEIHAPMENDELHILIDIRRPVQFALRMSSSARQFTHQLGKEGLINTKRTVVPTDPKSTSDSKWSMCWHQLQKSSNRLIDVMAWHGFYLSRNLARLLGADNLDHLWMSMDGERLSSANLPRWCTAKKCNLYHGGVSIGYFDESGDVSLTSPVPFMWLHY